MIETIEKLIRHFKPNSVDVAQFVQNVLATIAKALSLQIKDKAAHKTSCYNIAVRSSLCFEFRKNCSEPPTRRPHLLAD